MQTDGEGNSAPTLADGLGLLNPAELTLYPPPEKKACVLNTKAARKLLKKLDALVHQHRADEVTLLDWEENPTTTSVVDADWRFAEPGRCGVERGRIGSLPLGGIWEKWLADRKANLWDEDGLELARAWCLLTKTRLESGSLSLRGGSLFYDDEGAGTWGALQWVFDAWESIHGKIPKVKLCFGEVLKGLLEAILKVQPPEGLADFALDLFETELAGLPLDASVGRIDNFGEIEGNFWQKQYVFGAALMDGLGIGDDDPDSPQFDPRQMPPRRPLIAFSPWREWCEDYFPALESLDEFIQQCGSDWTEAHELRRFQLLQWFDRPTEKRDGTLIPIEGVTGRKRVDVDLFIKGSTGGMTGEADVIDHLIGPRGRGEQFGLLHEATKRNAGDRAELAGILEAAERCRDRVLEVESRRDENDTEAIDASLSIQSVPGAVRLWKIVSGLGDSDPYLVSRYGQNWKGAVAGRLLSRTFPEPEDTVENFSNLAATAVDREKRLIQVALLAPCWAEWSEAALGWGGFADAVRWAALHGYEWCRSYSMDDREKSEWLTEFSPWTELSLGDFQPGNVDVSWFWKFYEKLGKSRWDQLVDTAETVLHEEPAEEWVEDRFQMRFFSDTILGKVGVDAVLERIEKERDFDSVCALGLVPLSGDTAREADILRRREVFAEFVRKSSEWDEDQIAEDRCAAKIGGNNLRRTMEFGMTSD